MSTGVVADAGAGASSDEGAGAGAGAVGGAGARAAAGPSAAAALRDGVRREAGGRFFSGLFSETWLRVAVFVARMGLPKVRGATPGTRAIAPPSDATPVARAFDARGDEKAFSSATSMET